MLWSHLPSIAIALAYFNMVLEVLEALQYREAARPLPLLAACIVT